MVTKEFLRNVRSKTPLIQCITNNVTILDCANALLAIGASPTMSHAWQEAGEVQHGCDALVLNLGATESFKAMELAVAQAGEDGHPIVLDPVGVGGSTYRRDFMKELIASGYISCIRGNAAEIASAVTGKATVTGVDEPQDGESGYPSDKETAQFALENRLTVVRSGPVDYITNGNKDMYSSSGDPMMKRITGTGCMSSCIIGAFLAANPKDFIMSAYSACEFIGDCGERAARETAAGHGGTMTFRQNFIDELSRTEAE
ncbi:MAG: hydroxyethylthiazole kinase [Lachnospiraceae bacterium]|nr:hydroxyethylthiazole kinase [Lachnospiraceae bacterium]